MAMYEVNFKGTAYVEADSKAEAEDFVLTYSDFYECESLEASAIELEEQEM